MEDLSRIIGTGLYRITGTGLYLEEKSISIGAPIYTPKRTKLKGYQKKQNKFRRKRK